MPTLSTVPGSQDEMQILVTVQQSLIHLYTLRELLAGRGVFSSPKRGVGIIELE